MAKLAKRPVTPSRQTARPRSKQPGPAKAPLTAKAPDGPAVPVSTGGELALTSAGRGERQQLVLALQQTHGNLAVGRMIRRSIRRHDERDGETEIEHGNAYSGRSAIQRHTSVELEDPENAIQRSALRRMMLQRDLASDLTGELDADHPAPAKIYAFIDAATRDGKIAILNNSPLLARLRKQLSLSEYSAVLRKLGASLADQIDYTITFFGVDEVSLLSAIEAPGVPAAQKLQVLHNPALMDRIRSGLSRTNAVRAVRSLGGSLTEQLTAAIDAEGKDEAPIFTAIVWASPDQRLAAARDRLLMQRLSGALNRPVYLQALDQLGAPLVDQLYAASEGTVDLDAVLGIIRRANDAQKRELVVNQTLINRLRSKLDLDTMLSVMAELKASLADRLIVALDGAYAHAVTLVQNASADERLQIRESGQMIDRMRATMPTPMFEQIALLVGVPAVQQPAAVPVGVGAAAVGTATAPAVDAVSGAGPVIYEPRTLVGKVNAALDQTPPDRNGALAALYAAPPAEIPSLADDRGLRMHFLSALDDATFYGAMLKLGMTFIQRLSAMMDRGVPAAFLMVQVAAASADEKRSALDDRLFMRRLGNYAGDSLRDAIMAGLGDTPANRLEQVLSGKADVDAVKEVIRALDPGEREAVLGNSGLMSRIAAICLDTQFLRIQFLLIYGQEVKFPTQVMGLLISLGLGKKLDTIRASLANMDDADIVKIAPAVREYMRPYLSPKDFETLSRYLHLGLITEETIDYEAPEWLLVDDPKTVPIDFSPKEFTGNAGFDVGYYRDRVQVTVRIEFEPIDIMAAANLSALMAGWERSIEASWDAKFSLRNARRTLPIRIDMVYNSGKPQHHVNVGSAVNVAWPGYNTANWFYQAAGYNLVNAPLHEFGHMLGNPDEYNLSAIDYIKTVGKNPFTDPQATSQTDVAGVSAFQNNTSLMGAGGTVEKRHLNYFTNWLNKHRQQGEPAYTLV